ncbi:TPA: hypothetical protein NKQ52_004671 [Vibrio parahaemolyticus]|nr:hypothetical protein [Vibrio parahaemolyticus]MDF4873595.1 tRNA-guanine transglycosylase DpdA [Vibrio parahaemolyticus]HCG8583610.1 hypothetical protein [Vibrio parahaemolyticus]HCG9752864.1 hypothetical protein [Vibrio parahaemolyticus]HCH1656959.1 hypothetical protein [Vibrio parahaemolyticus]
MKFFFPDSQDFVDPNFDFVSEKRTPLRVRQRDDVYAHEIIKRPYDGILISKAIVEGLPGRANKTRYSEGQKYRLFREGAHRFFRLDKGYEVMGDSGAFSYIRDPEPPYTVDDLIDFYVKTKVNQGVSLDHIVMGYRDERSRDVESLPENKELRVEMTLENAADFYKKAKGNNFIPYGVAQGWNIESYVNSVVSLQKMGYGHITLGGIITLDSIQICRLLEEIQKHLKHNLKLHLLGIGRLDFLHKYKSLNVSSIDTTTPLKQAFLDQTKNYRLGDKAYSAIRIPQSGDNQIVKREISSGRLDQKQVKTKEREALAALRAFDVDELDLETALEVVLDYESILSDRRDKLYPLYQKTLKDRPWKTCNCPICRKLGIEVVIYRGSERNKRRGFHNLNDFYTEMARNFKC